MSLRTRLHEVIFEADTRAGRLFDVALLVAILASVTAICLESVPEIAREHRVALRATEWGFTLLFTVEYLLRLYCVRRPRAYATSFFGLIDLIAVLPLYLGLLFATSPSLAAVRVMRLVRVFRVLKLARFLGEASVLRAAIRASLPKVSVFLLTVLCLVVVVAAAMHVIEGSENGFDSIPRSMYWAVVTLTTVGYGDIAPHTIPGQFLASLVMLLGYSILAVPTGIVTAELTRRPTSLSTQACPSCTAEGHDSDAAYCRRCGAKL